MTRVRTLLLMLIGLAALWAGTAVAASGQLFRYENDEGVIVLSNSIPPRYVPKGYTVLDTRGRVVRVVPRQLTAAEIAQRERERAAEEARLAEERERYQRDMELMRLYSGPAEVEKARERRVASIENAIATTQSNIERLRLQQRAMESRAADLERAGIEVAPELVANLRSIEIQIAEREADIAARREEIERTNAEFARDDARLRYLLRIDDEAEIAAEDEGSDTTGG